MFVQKRVVVDVGLCERHQKRVLWGRLIGWGGLAIELLLVGTAISTGDSAYGLAALFVLLPWTIASIVVNRLVLAQRIDDEIVRLKGCGPEFLRSLPDRA